MSTYGLSLKKPNLFFSSQQSKPKAEANTVEARYNESLHNEVVDVTHGFLYPNNSKIHEKELRHNETSV